MTVWQEIERELKRRRIPELMAFTDGSRIDGREDWNRRRQEMKEVLCRELGGFGPSFSVSTKGEVCSRDENAYGGKAVKENILLKVEGEGNVFSFAFDLYMPKEEDLEKVAEKAPVFVHLGPSTPLEEEIIDNGFALANINCQDLSPDRNDGFVEGLGSFYERDPQKGWGKIGMWSYGVSRAADYLCERSEIDAGRMAVIGHSRMGKTALWCGAMDERFSLTVSNDSGAGGAALFRGKKGQRVSNLVKKFDYWFCGNFQSYADREEELPFDQHFLLALIAPRHLYVASASRDEWADPVSEFLGCAAASPAFELCGVQGLVLEKTNGTGHMPMEPLHEGHIGYHLRQGTHHLGREDWNHVMEYRRKHEV